MAHSRDDRRLRPQHLLGGAGMPRRLRVHQQSSAALGAFEPASAQPQVVASKDNTIRWQPGERLNHLFEQACTRFGEREAIVTETATLTFDELDRRANQVARHLTDQGIKAGDRVGLLFDKSAETYVALLAVLKVNAAYVPLDGGFPPERIRFILADAGIAAIVSMTEFEGRLRDFDVRQIYLDAAKPDIDAKPDRPLIHLALANDPLCYIIYTSGTTGNPKGVMIDHPSICNFVRVAASLYGYAPGDRVYQGMTIAFDFSVEEIWVPLLAGATLVPARPGISLVGEELADFLIEHRVTCVACCPTLLATIERDLPALRLLLVGGEACPQNLVTRWAQPGRKILNSYGPTEATVTATLTELTPDKPVTIGKPLPTYSIVILDPVHDQAVSAGELGEIGIAGIGLAAGYLNRDELTRAKFIPDFLNIAGNTSRRIYRTGDLGRVNSDGEIEYRGRIDTQVKIRGYRIELGEIEAALLDMPQIAQAAVTTFEPEPGVTELVAYYARKQGAPELSRNALVETLRERLPAYMVPTYLEELDVIPMTLSNKADHKKLPKPKSQRVRNGGERVEPATKNERVLVRALADVLKHEDISTAHHFFNDLGANSLLMARFCAQIRKNPGMSNVSMRDIYTNPTVSTLASHLDHTVIEGFIAAKEEPFHNPSNLAYYGCGALQLAFYAAYTLLGLWVFATGLSWTYAAVDHPFELYVRSVVFAASVFIGFNALAIGAKWLLIGRWKAESFPIWSLRYFRFWVVKTLTRSAPAAAFVGSPIYNLYLRLLGAKIGRNSVILSRFVPVSTDLFSVGSDSVLRKDSILLGYRAQNNFIHVGPVEIGSHAFVGEASVLDIDTAMGDRTQLGHASSLQSGQRVPDGQHYHGSPARETKADYCPIDAARCSPARRRLYAALQLLGLIAVAAPLPVVALNYWYPYFAAFAGNTANLAPGASFVVMMLAASAVAFFGSLVTGLAGVYVLPRLCQHLLTPGRTYTLYGFHYWLQRTIFTASNSRFYNVLFGDSSLIVSYMRFIGWRLNEVEQTGSNFGTNQRHDNPFLCNIGSRTMVSDGLSMINMHMSSSAFRLAEAKIGASNYLGNDIHYPPDGRTGANCLLGTKVMIPIDGPVRENVGLLGSPAFEIPRMVERDREVCNALSIEERRQRIRRKNVHNLVTALVFLATRFAFFFAAVLVSHVAVLHYRDYGVLALFAAAATIAVTAVLYFAAIERASLRFRTLQPTMTSIYDPYFWSHERHWKLADSPIVEMFGGTPFKNLVSRMLGVKVGRKVYDGGCSITERSLTEIGEGTNLNEGSVLQAHSLEEGVFKSDHIRLRDGCTLGAGAFVHYGVTMGERVVLDADSFLMKGEMLDPHTGWRGNPAKMVRGAVARDQQPAANDDAPWQEPFEPRIAAE